MEFKTIKSDFILLNVAVIWGMAFVAQRMGMDHVGPYTFNGIRFALGGVSLLPFLWISIRKSRQRVVARPDSPSGSMMIKGGMVAGLVLFLGASLQQVGLKYTTAGKAGFITGLYVVIVPILGLLGRQRANAGMWSGAALAGVGLYFLSVTEAMTIAYGDILELMGALCFACHVLIIDRLARQIPTVNLSIIQCSVCSFLSLVLAFCLEPVSFQGIWAAAVPIVYGGVFSVGVAYSLQIYGQKDSHPAHAAILLSLESVVAAVGGWWILDEVLSGRGLAGCALMMGGMLVSQLYPFVTGGRRKHKGPAG